MTASRRFNSSTWSVTRSSVQSLVKIVEVALEEAAALLERHADGVELARVPARRHAEDQPPFRDHVEGAQRLGGDGRVAERQHHDAGAELDPPRAGGDGGQRADGVEDREGRLHAEDHVVPRPQRLEAQRLRALRVGDERVDVGRLGRPDEVLDGETEVHASPESGARDRGRATFQARPARGDPSPRSRAPPAGRSRCSVG